MIALSEKVKSSAFIQSVFITNLCLIVYWLGPTSTWEINDDVYYNLLYAGKLLTSSPEPHVLIINFVLSKIFVTFYTLIPGVPWYGFFHVASIVLAVFFLNYFYAMVRNNDKFVMRTILSLATTLPFLFYIQFTKTALVLGLAGYLGLYLLNESNNYPPRLKSLLLHAVAVSFIVLSYSLRKESFYLISILCSILIIKALLSRRKAFILSLSATALIIFLFSVVHNQNYGAEWKGGSKAITQMLNYGQFKYDDNKKIYDEAGFSRNDYDFLMNWGYIDEKVYSIEKLDYIYNNAKKVDINKTVYSSLKEAVSFPANNYIIVLGVFTFLIFAMYKQKNFFISVCIVFLFLFCVGVLAWQGRFPVRVSTAIAYALPWLILLQSGKLRNTLFTTVIAIAALVFVTHPVYGQYQDLRKISMFRLEQNQELHNLGVILSRSPTILATLGSTFPYEGILPFESHDYLSGANFIWICSMNNFPVQKKQLADNNISDIFSTLMTDDSAFIILHPTQTAILQKYIYEHYKENVNIFPTYIGKGLVMYQLRRLSGVN